MVPPQPKPIDRSFEDKLTHILEEAPLDSAGLLRGLSRSSIMTGGPSDGPTL